MHCSEKRMLTLTCPKPGLLCNNWKIVSVVIHREKICVGLELNVI